MEKQSPFHNHRPFSYNSARGPIRENWHRKRPAHSELIPDSPEETCGIHQPESTSGFQTHQFILVLAINAIEGTCNSLTSQATREFWPFSRVVIRMTIREPTGLAKQNVERASIVNVNENLCRAGAGRIRPHRIIAGAFPNSVLFAYMYIFLGKETSNFVATFADGHRKASFSVTLSTSADGDD
ncbi:hypothetical protein DFH08DRAFT_799658 [Mycena albidolilacea]|uniref:Uncharacterized protein n=1 Tax=Mycena albidolilacea TaxID=1033008 RepID=A0AAD7AM02_9AGAR|nr:hypothetical protein DFH08DRAFT_799658 [Mycena albidolilacea]